MCNADDMKPFEIFMRKNAEDFNRDIQDMKNMKTVVLGTRMAWATYAADRRIDLNNSAYFHVTCDQPEAMRGYTFQAMLVVSPVSIELVRLALTRLL